MARPKLFHDQVYVRLPKGTLQRLGSARGREAQGEFLRSTILGRLDALDGNATASRLECVLHGQVTRRLNAAIRREKFLRVSGPVGPGGEHSYLRALEDVAAALLEMRPLVCERTP